MSIISLDTLLPKKKSANKNLFEKFGVLGFCLGFFQVWIWWLERRKEDAFKGKPRWCLQSSWGPPSCLGQPQILETLYQITEIALISGVGGQLLPAQPRGAVKGDRSHGGCQLRVRLTQESRSGAL